jgi:hypothetical protein
LKRTPNFQIQDALNRRIFLKIGAVALITPDLSSLLPRDLSAAPADAEGLAGMPNFSPKARAARGARAKKATEKTMPTKPMTPPVAQ